MQLRWFRFIPYCLSALLFLTAFFAILAPLPLLVFAYQKRPFHQRWLFLVTTFMVNAGWVLLLSGVSSACLYAIWVVPVAFGLFSFITLKHSLEKSVIGTMVLVAGFGILAVGLYASLHHYSPWDWLQLEINALFDYLDSSVGSRAPHLGRLTEWEDLKQRVLEELPSLLFVFDLILVASNSILLLVLNPGRLQEWIGMEPSYFQKWKAPEHLVWPTLFLGFFLVFPVHPWASRIAINGFKAIMAVYGLQGMSILSYFLKSWKISGSLQCLFYGLSLLLFTPFILGLGFFDLWFDFRGKFRQV